MSRFPTLTHPPIEEALIDCRFAVGAELSMSELRDRVESIRTAGDVLEEQRQLAAEFSFASDGQSETKTPEIVSTALILRDPAKGLVRQFRRDGFTVSLLKNYQSWDGLLQEAKSAMSHSVNWCAPVSITRLATRFINIVVLPEGRSDLDLVLTKGPQIPGDVFDHVREFSHRTVMGTDDENVFGILDVGTYRPGPGQPAGLLIDVDVSTIEQVRVDFEEVSRVLGVLRILKNSIFFGSLTAEALERYR